MKCKPYDPPINGLISCAQSDIFGGEACTPQCSSTKEFARIPAVFYICQSSGTWFIWDSRPTVSLEMPWPDCTGKSTDIICEKNSSVYAETHLKNHGQPTIKERARGSHQK